MIRALLLGLAIGLTGCVSTPPPAPADSSAAEQAPATVSVMRDGDEWTAEYRFPRTAPLWAFIRSGPVAGTGQSWRVQSWSVETAGVRLERIGRYDALVAENGDVPHVVRIRFTPFTQALEADYVPALALSDGTIALFDDHFLVFSAASREVVADLPVDLDGQPIEDSGTQVTLRDRAGPVMHMGRRLSQVTTQNASSYILFGARDPIVTDAMAAVIDPALPPWMATALRELTPDILAHHAAALGSLPGGRPTLLAAWTGPTPGRARMNGGVIAGTMVMQFDGEGLLDPDAELRNIARWFIAHEGAHFWLGQAVRYERSRDAWITEGGADLLAVRTVQALDPSYDWRAELDRSIADCARLSQGRGVAGAEDRGEHRAYYACGAVFALTAEAASGRPFSAFARILIDANRDDQVLTRAEWLAELDRVSGDPSLAHDIGRLIDEGAEDPGAVIASLFARAGVPFERGTDGSPRLR